jgi:hypothetical protein
MDTVSPSCLVVAEGGEELAPDNGLHLLFCGFWLQIITLNIFISATNLQYITVEPIIQILAISCFEELKGTSRVCRWFRFAQLAKGKKFRP